MAAILHRRARGRYFTFPLALLLALQGISPCMALCDVARAEGSSVVAAADAEVPACHASKNASSQPEPASGSVSGIPCIDARGCCCVSDAQSRTPGESPVVPAARSGSGLSHEMAVASDSPATRVCAHVTVPHAHGDLSPPGARLFIAHHSLLI